METMSRTVIEKAKGIYQCLADEESKEIFLNKLLYSITGENKYWHDILNYRNQEVNAKLKSLIGKDREIILYGAGNNCAPARDICKTMGLKIACICDRDIEKQKTGCLGMCVISPEELIANHKEAVILITTTDYCEEVETFLESYFAKERILPVAGKELRRNLMSQYFPEDILQFEDGEIFVDGGCYDFETSRCLLEKCRVEKIYAFEPDKYNLQKVKAGIQNAKHENTIIFEKGLWNCSKTLYFNSRGDIQSHITSAGDETDKVEVTSLDEVISGRVTFIKMDIEGSELKALEGAKRLIQAYKPKLAICIYHKPEDTIEIPSYIKNLVPEYRLYIRHYSWSPSETVLYATL